LLSVQIDLLCLSDLLEKFLDDHSVEVACLAEENKQMRDTAGSDLTE